jgi:hypothetical protein
MKIPNAATLTILVHHYFIIDDHLQLIRSRTHDEAIRWLRAKGLMQEDIRQLTNLGDKLVEALLDLDFSIVETIELDTP